MNKQFRDVICEILEQAGPAILNRPGQFSAYVTDLAIDFPKEKMFLAANCTDEYLACFRKAGESRLANEQAIVMGMKYLTETKLIDEKWARKISTEIARGIGAYNGLSFAGPSPKTEQEPPKPAPPPRPKPTPPKPSTPPAQGPPKPTTPPKPDPPSPPDPPPKTKKGWLLLIPLIIIIGLFVWKPWDKPDPEPDPDVAETTEGVTDIDDLEAPTDEESQENDQSGASNSASDYWSQYQSDFVLWDSSTSFVSLDRIDGLSQNEAQHAINEIFARHGCIFNDEDIDQYFQSCEWYSPSVKWNKFSQSQFNPYEWANLISLIPRRSMKDEDYNNQGRKMVIREEQEALTYMEKYAKDNYGIDIYEDGLDMIVAGSTQNVYNIECGKLDPDAGTYDKQWDWMVFGDGSIYDLMNDTWVYQKKI